MRPRVVTAVVLLFAGLSPLRASAQVARFEFTEPHMGTQFRIVIYAGDREAAHKATRAAFDRIASLDASMSDYKDSSELMRLCAKAGGDPVKVSDDLFFVLAKAVETSEKSDGAFDVTVGPVVRLWRKARRTRKLPDADDLKKALALVGYKNIKLDREKQTVQLLKQGMLLDLGGIAKGYAGDEAQKVLKKHGVTSALVAAGGDVVVSGAPPGTEGWEIGIQPLDPAEKEKPKHLLLKDAAVSTSGDVNQHVEIDGARYSHIVDPKTGLGLTGERSVTVVAPNGVTSDSTTKIVMILGEEKGFKIVEAMPGVSSRYVRRTEKGAATQYSKGFPKLYDAKD
jgi:thiamine biosynthesis lipoprotein